MKTLAVTIGNNNYHKGAELINAVNDARAMSETFKKLGYATVHYENFKADDCVNILTEFENNIIDYDASIFYFAGHGFQVQGENFLTSTECQISHPNIHHCRRYSIGLTEILDILKQNSEKINIVIIDACRKNFGRGVSNSFAAIQAPKGTLIAFSTSPNEGAKDGGIPGHSIYTGALLKYIGREWLSVELLFKKVRKTVYYLTDGKQTPWEHTSLIGDFYFNTGQLLYSIDIPYDEKVVKDSKYKSQNTQISSIIIDLKSYNWNIQNPAVDRFHNLNPNSLNINEQFIFGRNILQASTYAFNASNFIENLSENLKQYNNNGENHILNGILYEIYFNSFGEFRKESFKKHHFEDIMGLRKNVNYNKSFEFIKTILLPYKDFLFYIPNPEDEIIDVDILANDESSLGFRGETEEYQVIHKIIISNIDITEELRTKYGLNGRNEDELIISLANYLLIPKDLIQINCNVTLNSIAFRTNMDTEYDFNW